MRPRRAILTPQELQIMKVVWSRRAATVRDVYEDLRSRRRIAYTTVMTMMNILERKGHLKKQTEGRSFVYRPVRPRCGHVGADRGSRRRAGINSRAGSGAGHRPGRGDAPPSGRAGARVAAARSLPRAGPAVGRAARGRGGPARAPRGARAILRLRRDRRARHLRPPAPRGPGAAGFPENGAGGAASRGRPRA